MRSLLHGDKRNLQLHLVLCAFRQPLKIAEELVKLLSF